MTDVERLQRKAQRAYARYKQSISENWEPARYERAKKAHRKAFQEWQDAKVRSILGN